MFFEGCLGLDKAVQLVAGLLPDEAHALYGAILSITDQ